ncbi:MAG: transporter substrate-binding domain-containing protein [Alphaproteobacteria bacterium]|nr:transporter substrate-binding domain-containing protein [Alphaproteobacteria bacterium]MBV8548763.1 transporter substrate-binding domain-containing protein [Alphaproteobacteria bacterium]
MKSTNAFFLGLVFCAIIIFATTQFMKPAAPSAQVTPQHHETSYERVIRTGTLRCGFEYWDGGVMQTPASSQMTGAWADITEEVGKATGLKIEWAQQVGWADVGAALKSGKVDAICAGMWQSAIKAKEITFSLPVTFQSIEAFAAADDQRFDNNLQRVNAADVTAAVIDSDNSDFIAQMDFPLARRFALGSLSGTDTELLMTVATGKANVTFVAPGAWRQFTKNNPGKLRRVAPGQNLRVFGQSFATDNDDHRLMDMLNVAVQEIINAGAVDRILKKYENDYPDMYLKNAKPYQQ